MNGQELKEHFREFDVFLDVCFRAQSGSARKPMPVFDKPIEDLKKFYEDPDHDLFVIKAAPRFGKSLTFVISYTLWLSLKYPGFSTAIMAGVTEELINKFSLDMSNIVNNRMVQILYPELIPTTDNQHHIVFSNGSFVKFYRAEGNILGQGFNLICVDDFYMKLEGYMSETNRKGINSFIYSSLVSRRTGYNLTDEITLKPKFLVTSAPWGPMDHISMIKEMFPDYLEHKIPCMYQNDAGEWVSNHYLETTKYYLKQKETFFHQTGNDGYFNTQYMCIDDQVLTPEFSLDDRTLWFDSMDWTRTEKFQMAIDFSMGRRKGADFTACLVFFIDESDCIKIVDGFKVCEKIEVTKDMILKLAKRYQVSTIHAEKDFMTQGTLYDLVPFTIIIEEYAKLHNYVLKFSPLLRQYPKVTKIAALAGYVNSGRFKINKECHSLKNDFYSELVAYPNILHDDYVLAATVIALKARDIPKTSRVVLTHVLPTVIEQALSQVNQRDTRKSSTSYGPARVKTSY